MSLQDQTKLERQEELSWRSSVRASERRHLLQMFAHVIAPSFFTTSPQALAKSAHMDHSAGSPSSIRQREESLTYDEDLQAAQKRRRLSAAHGSPYDAHAGLRDPDSSLYDDLYKSDTPEPKAQTPPRGTPPHSFAEVKLEPTERQSPRQLGDPAHNEHSDRSCSNQAAVSQSFRSDYNTVDTRESLDRERHSTTSSHASTAARSLAGRPSAHVPPAALLSSCESAMLLPKFNPRYPNRWSAECEVALIDFVARDSYLCRWATMQKPGERWPSSETDPRGVADSLQRFSDLTEGPPAHAVRYKLFTWRDIFNNFVPQLTPDGRATHISRWSLPDRELLQKYEMESRSPSRWLRHWFESVHLGATSSVSDAATVRRTRAVLSGAPPGSSHIGASLEGASDTESHSYRAQLAAMERGLKQQERSIALLQTRDEVQQQLVAKQTALLEKQAALLQSRTQQMERLEQTVERQAQAIERHAAASERQAHASEREAQKLERLAQLVERHLQ